MNASTFTTDDPSASQGSLPEFYSNHPEANRTLRMDSGGVCQFCARKSARRVELHSPLWQAGPIMYGECCLPRAEAALLTHSPGVRLHSASVYLPGTAAGKPFKAWQAAAAATGLGAVVVWLERLLHLGLFKSF